MLCYLRPSSVLNRNTLFATQSHFRQIQVSDFSCTCFRFVIADFTAKKAKVMDRPPRVRHSIQLEVDPESEGRLQRVKSQIQSVKSFLRITSRTPMGNLLMMEKLFQVFHQFEQSGMTSETPSWVLRSSQEPGGSKTSKCDVAIQTDILPPYVLASGENTTGCYDIRTPSKPVEDYFIASNDALPTNRTVSLSVFGSIGPAKHEVQLKSTIGNIVHDA